MDFINKLIYVWSKYYPGIMEEFVFVNTSLVFRSIWAPYKYIYMNMKIGKELNY